MTISLPWLVNLLYAVIRLGTIILFTPVQAIRQLPIHTRLILIFILAILMINQVPEQHEFDNARLLIGGLAEFSNGLILGASIYASFAIFRIAGQIIDNETGFNSLAVFNPAEHSQDPVSSHLLSMLAVLFFFNLDGHLWLFKGLAFSFAIIPPGSLRLFSGFSPGVKQFGFMFGMAFMIASPIVLFSLIVELSGTIITRNMPQISTWFLTLPIKIITGLMLLALIINYLNPIASKIFAHCFQTWQELMS